MRLFSVIIFPVESNGTVSFLKFATFR